MAKSPVGKDDSFDLVGVYVLIGVVVFLIIVISGFQLKIKHGDKQIEKDKIARAERK